MNTFKSSISMSTYNDVFQENLASRCLYNINASIEYYDISELTELPVILKSRNLSALKMEKLLVVKGFTRFIFLSGIFISFQTVDTYFQFHAHRSL